MSKRKYTILDLGDKKHTNSTEYPLCWLIGNEKKKVKITLAGLGDVGGTALIGLALLGGDVIESIGIYDLSQNKCQRWEMEMNQIYGPSCTGRMPQIKIISEEEIFCCDVFVFCVAKGVPGIEQKKIDVRMAQFDVNRKIVSYYAKMAADREYQGLFAVVSDPVDLLAREALYASRSGKKPLLPQQIQGCGLGVMNARAVYHARKDDRFSEYLEEGRVFGPHGKGLIAANSLDAERYDDAISCELSQLVITSNLKMREIGYKPYIAPALSSAVLTILQIITGKWNYSSCYLNGIYFGARNRTTLRGIQWEISPLPESLFDRLRESYHNLEMIR